MNILLFVGRDITSQVLTTNILKGLVEKKHKVSLVFANRNVNGKNTNIVTDESFLLIDMLHDVIFDCLDAEIGYVEKSFCWTRKQLEKGHSYIYCSKDDINSEKLMDFIALQQVDAAIACRFPFILDAQVIAQVKSRGTGVFWNLHSAPLPDYAGYSPLRWLMDEGEDMAGFTLHEIEEKVDSGKIITRNLQPVDYALDFSANLRRMLPQTIADTLAALDAMISGEKMETVEIPKGKNYKFYPQPTKEVARRMYESGITDIDVDRLKAYYLDVFSRCGTPHHEVLKCRIEEALHARVEKVLRK